MKRQIEKPSSGPMRFFTPELYERFNSADEKIADLADQEWETATRQYQQHLATIRERLPRQAIALTELSLHDAELLVCDQDFEPLPSLPGGAIGASPYWLANAIVSIKLDDKIVTLVYVLWDRVREHPPASKWPFSKLRKHWLYDEVDAPNDYQGRFLHRILFSDGSVLEVPFLSVMIHIIPWPTVADRGSMRKGA